jgi:hypothetical protein
VTKQYRVFYKRLNTPSFAALEPGVHAQLYDVPEVQGAVQILRDHPEVQAVVVRREDALFNVVSFEQDAMAPKSFLLNPAPAATEGVS